MGKKFDKIAGSISPLYGIISGKGAFGNIGNVVKHGVLGAAMRSGSEEEEEDPAAAKKPGDPVKLAKGGRVRGGGCAKRGMKFKG